MTFSRQFVLATFNADKLLEIQAIWRDEGLDLVSLMSYPNATSVPETGDTFQENALIKARAAFQLTGLPSVADDSGLEVDCLDGQPGVYSSRFAGEDVTYRDNNEKLLSMMQDVPASERTARFRCVVALVDEASEHWVEGTCEGCILFDYRGTDGFGYDPLFFVPEKGKTFAEMTGAEKHEISHRGQAFWKMAEFVRQHK